jgi:hypothetical protein
MEALRLRRLAALAATALEERTPLAMAVTSQLRAMREEIATLHEVTRNLANRLERAERGNRP